MTAPTPRLSPTAGFVNAMARHAIRGLDARVRELEGEVADAREAGHALRIARDFNASRAAGYIDRSGLDSPRETA
ncbi:hypothetical protein MUK60_07730 [Streptomyces sp. LRE541]|uniref:hypothetical protein n=1 Tax=Streptomyces sp. LRE541 TaxID=2931983 RepID=UPI00200E0B1B|nr:hypothetical protein [Streptomyces sp. LRE541]UPZ27724.1 hypothetical protein MUK60_07730 [Streptomyces sp. LRE541]